MNSEAALDAAAPTRTLRLLGNNEDPVDMVALVFERASCWRKHFRRGRGRRQLGLTKRC